MTSLSLTVPRRYDGHPLCLQNLDAAARRDGILVDLEAVVRSELGVFLLGNELRRHARLLRAFRAIADRLLVFFTGRRVDDHYVLELIPTSTAALLAAQAPELALGFNMGPFCFAPDGPPNQVLSTWFHELGHAMFPSAVELHAEVAAFYVHVLFHAKLRAESSYFAIVHHRYEHLSDLRAEAYAQAVDLYDGGRGPTTRYTYGADFLADRPTFKHLLVPGTVIRF